MSDEERELEEFLEENEVLDEQINNIEQEDEITDLEDVDETEGELVEPEGETEEVVKRAKKYGHLSKEDWIAQGRDPDQWKSPEEFDKTGKIIEQVYSLRKEMERKEREVKALIAYQERTEQRALEQARRELESKLAASKDDMDVEGVAHYTEELTKLHHNEQNTLVQQAQRAQVAAKEAFVERNQHWFNDRNPDLQQRAIEIDNEIQKDINSGRLSVNSYDDIGVMIEKRLSYEYPERILGSSKVNRPTVSPSRSSVNKTAVNTNSSKKVFQGLSQELKDTYNAHKRIRASLGEELTEAEFIERLKKDGEL